MPNRLHGYRGISATSRRKSWAYPGLLLVGMSVIVAYLAAPRPILSQSEHKDSIEGSLLPATTGEPLTIKPLNMQDIDCIVAQWRPTPTKPILTLICPPNTVFAPLRVLIKLSWMKTEDVPVNPEHILAPAGTPTKIRTNKTAAQVLLQADENGEGKLRSTWIGFNAVVDVALLSGRAK
jgi:hypothetical protein